MRYISATEAKQNFAAVLDDAQHGGVVILRHDREVAAVVSMDDFEIIRKIRIQELLQLSAEIGKRAAERGMTEEILAQILADDEPKVKRK